MEERLILAQFQSFQSKVSQIHCFGPQVRQNRASEPVMVAPPQLMAARKQRETDKKGPEQDVTLRETPAIHFLKPGS
jgi:hypothetical protein